jgi:hypothetical protein
VEHGEPNTASVYDFLYYDTTRIASFLSQFDPSGHLTEVTQGEQIHRRKLTKSSSQIKGSLAVIEGGLSLNSEVDTGDGKESRRTYDPRWANALAFLDYIDANQLLHRDVLDSSMGQIVLFSGDLVLFDQEILRNMWGLDGIKKVLNAAANAAQPNQNNTNRQGRRHPTSSGKHAKDALPTETELGLEMLTVLPHAVQAAVTDGDISVWSTLREDSLTIAPSDLFLKHGLTIDGTWNIVGILDAFPDNEEGEPPEIGLSISMARQFTAGLSLGYFGTTVAPHLVAIVRQLLGRPSTSYGFTPLLLFREIST